MKNERRSMSYFIRTKIASYCSQLFFVTLLRLSCVRSRLFYFLRLISHFNGSAIGIILIYLYLFSLFRCFPFLFERVVILILTLEPYTRSVDLIVVPGADVRVHAATLTLAPTAQKCWNVLMVEKLFDCGHKI